MKYFYAGSENASPTAQLYRIRNFGALQSDSKTWDDWAKAGAWAVAWNLGSDSTNTVSAAQELYK